MSKAKQISQHKIFYGLLVYEELKAQQITFILSLHI